METQVLINRIWIAIITVVVLVVIYRFRKLRILNIGKALRLAVASEEYLNLFAKSRSVEFAPNAIITINEHGCIVSWNRAAEIMFGIKEADMLDKDLTSIIPERFKAKHKAGIKRLAEGGASTLLGKSVEMVGLRKVDMSSNYEEFPIELTIWPWEDNDLKFYTGIVRNLIIEKSREAQRIGEIHLYRAGEEIDVSGVWTWDILKDLVESTVGFKKIFEIEPFTVLASEYLMKRVHPDDRDRVYEKIKKAFDAGEDYQVKYRKISRSGSISYIRLKAKVISEGEKRTSIIGVIHEISEKEYNCIKDDNTNMATDS